MLKTVGIAAIAIALTTLSAFAAPSHKSGTVAKDSAAGGDPDTFIQLMIIREADGIEGS
jgi:hypothetical protein